MNYANPKQILHGFGLPRSDSLTIGQVAGTLGVSAQTVHNLIRDGELEGTNIAAHSSKHKSWRISRTSLVDFLNRRTTGPAVDFQALEAPHGLDLPLGKLFGVPEVLRFLSCSTQHVLNLIRQERIRATNIARTTSGKARYRIARSSLIQFINDRTEGAY